MKQEGIVSLKSSEEKYSQAGHDQLFQMFQIDQLKLTVGFISVTDDLNMAKNSFGEMMGARGKLDSNWRS